MALETGTYVADLVKTNPPTSDLETQGANHLQLIKTVLQNTFPNGSRVVGCPTMVAKSANYSIVVGDAQTTFVCSTGGGSFTLTLPSLAAGDAGWEITVLKLTTDTNPVFVVPPSGTMQSGEITALTKIRRCIPGRKGRIFWTGTTFIAERVDPRPFGSVEPCWQTTTPVGYELADGATLASASTNYPEYFAVFGSGVKPDVCARTIYGQDTAATGRISVAGGNFNAAAAGTAGGAQNHALSTAEIPIHNHGVTSITVGTESAQHTHNNPNVVVGATSRSGIDFNAGSFSVPVGAQTLGATNVENSTHNHALGGTTDNAGSGAAHTVLSPGIAMRMLVLVE